ncbi:hypothetical protein psyc5s11_30450 [Clostridium gelidum]|uniref:Uncharacterized protein n=1 Tax=Clostridium gelidum TaxID=704125 RepID=A0ABN6IZP8_9CLOT|nr:hypothetical protein [Clostridium gelidum]BCZ46978.1 hypothetical protein psyc5s11_30450 [Clostridium gelidum]
MNEINIVMDNGINVFLNTLSQKQIEIEVYYKYSSLFKEIINDIYLNYPTKQSILNTLVEVCLNFEHSIFCVVNGFYENSMDSLRKSIELVVFGIYFDKHPGLYTTWLSGRSEFGFKQKLNEIYTFSELGRWANLSFFNSLNDDIYRLFQELSSYTHSNPTKWQQSQRYTNHLEFLSDSFDIWFNDYKIVIEYSTTLLLLYLPEIVNQASSVLIDHARFEDIMNNIL